MTKPNSRRTGEKDQKGLMGAPACSWTVEEKKTLMGCLVQDSSGQDPEFGFPWRTCIVRTQYCIAVAT